VSCTTHLDWTMDKRTGPDRCAAALILLLVVLTLNAALWISRRLGPQSLPETDTTFVQIAGAVRNPGVFAFSQSPRLEELALKTGFSSQISNGADSARFRFPSGARVQVIQRDNRVRVETGQMTAFYKVTLRIPISLNFESPEGLTALPGIGPGLAKAIATKRTARNGFSAVENLLSVPGVSQRLFRKIRPYVKP